jgi:hypothetical protein
MFSYLVCHGSEVHDEKDEPAHPGAAVLPEERPEQEKTYGRMTDVSDPQSSNPGSAMVPMRIRNRATCRSKKFSDFEVNSEIR